MMDISAIKNVFGECQYKEVGLKLQRFHMRYIAYRDASSVCYLLNLTGEATNLKTDEEIIKDTLSKLTYDELNATDDNGASILHLAVQYNRAGQIDEHASFGMAKETNKNIVKWLINNPAFNQEDAKGKFHHENYTPMVPNGGGDRKPVHLRRGNALHLAYSAQVPKHITFYSENHGGDFGNLYVASEALDSMLSNEHFTKAHINSCNEDGLTVLEYALQMAMVRLSKIGEPPNQPDLDIITFNNWARFDKCRDTSIFVYAGDYSTNIKKLLKCTHLRVHGMFGIVMISNVGGNYLMPEQLVSREGISSLDWTPSKGMNEFIKICTQGGKDMSFGERFRIVNAILSNSVGQLPDSVKAQSMLCISPQSQEWTFNPAKMADKKVGAVVRKFFVKHAKSALYAIQRYNSVIHREYHESLLVNTRNVLCQRHSLSRQLWTNILAYAGYRLDNESCLRRLSGLNDSIQNSVLPFFFGCIQACIDRRLQEDVPAVTWELIFQYAGLRPISFPNNLDEILGPICMPKLKQGMAEAIKTIAVKASMQYDGRCGYYSDEDRCGYYSDEDLDEQEREKAEREMLCLQGLPSNPDTMKHVTRMVNRKRKVQNISTFTNDPVLQNSIRTVTSSPEMMIQLNQMSSMWDNPHMRQYVVIAYKL